MPSLQARSAMTPPTWWWMIAPRPAPIALITLLTGVGLVEHQCSSARRCYQAQDHPQRRRLTGAVRVEKTRDPPGLQREREIRTCWNVTERLINDSASTTAVTGVAAPWRGPPHHGETPAPLLRPDR